MNAGIICLHHTGVRFLPYVSTKYDHNRSSRMDTDFSFVHENRRRTHKQVLQYV